MEYQLKIADLTGELNGQPTMATKQLEANLFGTYNGQPTLALQSSLAEAGLASAQSGIMPSESQLAALEMLYGYPRSAVESMVQTSTLGKTPSYTGGSYSGSRTTGNTTSKLSGASFAILMNSAAESQEKAREIYKTYYSDMSDDQRQVIAGMTGVPAVLLSSGGTVDPDILDYGIPKEPEVDYAANYAIVESVLKNMKADPTTTRGDLHRKVAEARTNGYITEDQYKTLEAKYCR
jgi:hypothetical protein